MLEEAEMDGMLCILDEKHGFSKNGSIGIFQNCFKSFVRSLIGPFNFIGQNWFFMNIG